MVLGPPEVRDGPLSPNIPPQALDRTEQLHEPTAAHVFGKCLDERRDGRRVPSGANVVLHFPSDFSVHLETCEWSNTAFLVWLFTSSLGFQVSG